jgi:hypothetical protein
MDSSVGINNKKNINKKHQKQPKSITMAENWKQKEIKQVLTLRDEMISNNIDEKLIKKYLDEQYAKINQQYQEKIKKYMDKQKKSEEKNVLKELKNKREKAIEILLKNKNHLEKNGASPEFIKNYMEKQYKDINQMYSINSNLMENIDLDNINFID